MVTLEGIIKQLDSFLIDKSDTLKNIYYMKGILEELEEEGKLSRKEVNALLLSIATKIKTN